jgi:hypothetical protein
MVAYRGPGGKVTEAGAEKFDFGNGNLIKRRITRLQSIIYG